MIKFKDWLELQEMGTGSNCIAVVPSIAIGNAPLRTRIYTNKKKKKFEEWLVEEYPTASTMAPNGFNQINTTSPVQVPPKPSLAPVTVSQPNSMQTQTAVGKGGMNLRNVINNPKNAQKIISAVQKPNDPKSLSTINALTQTIDGTNPNAMNAIQ